MPTLTIKNMPDELYRILKNRAELNRRSLNSEILMCLERAATVEQVDAAETQARLARADAARGLLERREVKQLTQAAIRAAKGRGRP